MSEISEAEMKRVHDLFFPPEDSSPLIVKLKNSPDKLRQLTTKLAANPKPVSKSKGIKLQLKKPHAQSDSQQPVSAAVLVKVFETGITTFLEDREEKFGELQIQLRVQNAEIGRLRSEAEEFDKVRREFDVLKEQLEVERTMRETAENEKAQLEMEKTGLESQMASRKRTWEEFKERMESEHGAVSSIVQGKKGGRKEWNMEDLVIVDGDLVIFDGEEFERNIQQ
jgi:hypothetical protein